MSSDSPLFDRIRVKPDQDRRRRRAEEPACEWPRCDAPGTHRAPKGRNQANEYWRFCLDHVREYNHSYNFFAGMSDDAVAEYQKDSLTGHLPTWKMGMSGNGPSKAARTGRANFQTGPWAADDPFGVFGELGARGGQKKGAREGRTILNAERKAYHSLGLEADAGRTDIKAKFKELVKRHHPDANGGDRGSEDKLREIIQAYNYLKSAGRC
jgi:curved DNA-binding protein CbpA